MDAFTSSNLLVSYTDNESSEESKTNEENSNLKTKLKPNLIEKFNLLKHKRLQIEKRNEKRRQKKRSNFSKTNEQGSNELSSKLLKSPKDLPNVKILEKSLDQALNEANIEQAEKISDVIFAKQTQLNMLKRKEQIEFEEVVKRRLEEKGKKRSRLNWRFEAKQRWESKSNM